VAFYGSCPQCAKEVSQDRFINGVAICECGWTDTSHTFSLDRKNEMKKVKILFATAAVLVALYAHLLNWGSYAVEIPFVKLGQLTGTLSHDGYQELAGACIQLNKWECAKDAYLDLFTSKRDLNGLAERASLELRLGETQNALATYAQFFAAGGKNADASYQYGFLLENAGRPAEAMKAYEFGMANAGDRLPVKATTGLVQLLIKQGRYDEALARIETFHQSAGNATGYLNTEKAQLENVLGQQAKSTKKAPKRHTTGAVAPDIGDPSDDEIGSEDEGA